MNILEMTEREIYETGLEVLGEKLGAALPRFLHQCKPGSGDWSAARHNLLEDGLNVETLATRIQQAREQEGERKTEAMRMRQLRAAASQAELLQMTDLEIYETGLDVLCDKLGPVGMSRFRRYCAQRNVEQTELGAIQRALGKDSLPD